MRKGRRPRAAAPARARLRACLAAVGSGIRQLQQERADDRERYGSAKEILGRVPPWSVRPIEAANRRLMEAADYGLIKAADRRLVEAADRSLVEAADRGKVQILGQPPELPALPARRPAARSHTRWVPSPGPPGTS